MFSWLTSANWLGGPVPCVLALNLSLSFQDVVVVAAVPYLLLVAVLPHHSKGDEAVGYRRWDGAAHLWRNTKPMRVLRPEDMTLKNTLQRVWLDTSAYWWLCWPAVGHAHPPLKGWCLGRVALVGPTSAVHSGASRNRLVVENPSVLRRFRQWTVHRCRKRQKEVKLN